MQVKQPLFCLKEPAMDIGKTKQAASLSGSSLHYRIVCYTLLCTEVVVHNALGLYAEAVEHRNNGL